MKIRQSPQKGAALLVALVALVILTVLGVTTMGDVMNQSSVVRNEQFRQRVFYAASSELNSQINEVNDNAQGSDDLLIDEILASSSDPLNLSLKIDADSNPPVRTDPDDINIEDVVMNARRIENMGCDGESVDGVTMVAGEIDATAVLDDGRGSIQSRQRQRVTYCWAK